MTTTTYSQRHAQLSEQHAYERRVKAFGLSALLAPYAVREPSQWPLVPSQRVAA